MTPGDRSPAPLAAGGGANYTLGGVDALSLILR